MNENRFMQKVTLNRTGFRPILPLLLSCFKLFVAAENEGNSENGEIGPKFVFVVIFTECDWQISGRLL